MAIIDIDEIEMVEIPNVTFKIGKYPVTQAQYQEVMGTNPSYFINKLQRRVNAGCKKQHRPVEKVSWNDAVVFCKKLSETTGENYRLPTEAEWEYACRASTTTSYSFGDDPNQLRDYAWYKGNSGDTTHPVGLKLPNAWGIYDMHGNVCEWCQEGYLKGGSWGSRPYDCRSAYRGLHYRIDTHFNFDGFRVVCDK